MFQALWGQRLYSLRWCSIYPQCLENCKCLNICQINGKRNCITCFRRKTGWGVVLLTLVHFPNFLAVSHIPALNKYLFKEGRNVCAAAAVRVYAFWPYAEHHLLSQCGTARWAWRGRRRGTQILFLTLFLASCANWDKSGSPSGSLFSHLQSEKPLLVPSSFQVHD